MTPEGPRMTFGEHLEELRGRLFKSLIVLGLVLVFSMIFHGVLLEFITWPHFRAQDLLGVPPHQQRLVAMSPAGWVVALMKLAFIVSLFATSPWIGYQLWGFVAAGLYEHEKGWVARLAPVSYLLFLAGCVFGYFVLVPYSLYGLCSMLNLDIIAPTFTLSEYLDFVLLLTILLGGIFQVPLVMLLLSRLGVVKAGAWTRGRRAAVVANVVLAAAVSPGDLMTMGIVMAPLLALYEAGAIVARWGSGAGGGAVVHSRA